MKLTKERLVQIIKEEMETIEEITLGDPGMSNFSDPPQKPDRKIGQQKPTKMTSDVDRIHKLLPRIDNVKEYSELMGLVVSPEFPIKGVSDGNQKSILRRIRDKINGLLGGGEEPAV